MTITLYTFENADGTTDTYTTDDATEARERGQRYNLLVVAHEYEWADSETAWDYRPAAGD